MMVAGSKPSTRSGMDPTAHDQLQMKVVDFSGNTLEFKIKSHKALKKLMSTFCERAGLDLQSVSFIFDGQRVNGSDTAQSLGMEQGDVIDVVEEQPCKVKVLTRSSLARSAPKITAKKPVSSSDDSSSEEETVKPAANPAHKVANEKPESSSDDSSSEEDTVKHAVNPARKVAAKKPESSSDDSSSEEETVKPAVNPARKVSAKKPESSSYDSSSEEETVKPAVNPAQKVAAKKPESSSDDSSSDESEEYAPPTKKSKKTNSTLSDEFNQKLEHMFEKKLEKYVEKKLEQKMNEKFNMHYQKIYLQLQDLKEDIKAPARAPECPVCFEELRPPMKIIQCVKGHKLCEPCSQKPGMSSCPSCKAGFTGRDYGMEAFLLEQFQIRS